MRSIRELGRRDGAFRPARERRPKPTNDQNTTLTQFLRATEHTPSGPCWGPMDDTAADLRRHAAHCRFIARSAISERTRTILFTMATEFDDQAAVLDSGQPIAPPG